MRRILFLSILLISQSVFASNAFDAFIGKYPLSGGKKIPTDNIHCRRFGLGGATGLQIVAAPNARSGQTHILRFLQKSGGSISFSIQEYNRQDEFGGPEPRTMIASVNGSNGNYAQNVFQDYTNSEQTILTVSVGHYDGKIHFLAQEQHDVTSYNSSGIFEPPYSCSWAAEFKAK